MRIRGTLNTVIARAALDEDLGRLAEVKSNALDSRSRLVRLVWSLALALFFGEGSSVVGESDENGQSTAKLRMTAAKLVVTQGDSTNRRGGAVTGLR
jgi:hypothetical protein